MLDVLLSDTYKHHWPEIEKLARSKDPKAIEVLERYALEAYRINPAAWGLFRNVAHDTEVKDGDNTIKVKKGSQVYANFVRHILSHH